MMRKLILTGAALVALSMPAAAQSMPKDLQGKWCADDELSDRYVSGYTRSGGECRIYEIEMRVIARGFEIVDGDCTALNVTRKRGAYRIKFRCAAEGVATPLVTEQTWQIKQDTLAVTDAKANTGPRR
jgi:hypothetical protein